MGDRIRESWNTRLGFVLAAVGSAVGLGNIRRFPFQVGEEGGAVFLVVYLCFVILIGFPAMLVELSVGRKTNRNPVGALKMFGGGAWMYVGGLFVVMVFVIFAYYSVVSGWVLRYFFDSFTGAYTEDPAEYFVEISTGLDALFFHAVFAAVAIAIVALGVQRGIELAVKVMVPSIVVLVVGLAVYAFTLEGASAAYAYYLTPDAEVVLSNWHLVLPAAAGQAFFTLSLGMGVMITYSSYIDEDRNLSKDAGMVVSLDTLIAFVAGLIVLPILFTVSDGPSTVSGAGTVFVSLAGAFADLPYGSLVGAIFFGILALAALSSAISILEVAVSYLIDEADVSRFKAAVSVGFVAFLLGVPVTYNLVFIDLLDILAAEILLVAGSLLLMVLVAWLGTDKAIEELKKGIGDLGWMGTTWVWLIRVPVVVVLVVSLYLGFVDYAEFLREDFADFLVGEIRQLQEEPTRVSPIAYFF